MCIVSKSDTTVFTSGLFQKKIPWGKTAEDIFFYGWLVRKDFKLYGSLVYDQINLHGWLVFRCVEGEERILSAKKKERSFIKSSQKKALSLANSGNSHLFTRNRQTSDVSVEYW